MLTLDRTFALLRSWRPQRVAAIGIVVGRKVECESSVFVVLLDFHFEFEGRSHQARTRAAAFAEAARAQAALAQWPIGSFRRLTFSPGCPEAVSLA